MKVLYIAYHVDRNLWMYLRSMKEISDLTGIGYKTIRKHMKKGRIFSDHFLILKIRHFSQLDLKDSWDIV